MTLAEKLAEFRATHPAAHLDVGGVRWRYLRAGPAGAPAVLVLTGVLGRAELGFEQILAPETSFRVVAPDYPAVRTLDELADGLAAILDAEGIGSAHVTGGSFGGMAAQHWVRRRPQRVRSLVLSHTAAPGGRGPGKGTLRLLSLFPEGLLRALFRKRLGGSFAGADPFWPAFFHEHTATLSKAELLSRLRLAREFGLARHSAEDLAGWKGRVLILGSDDDPMFAAGGRDALRALYPGARVHTFSGTGHAAAILQPEAYADVIRRFIEG